MAGHGGTLEKALHIFSDYSMPSVELGSENRV